MGLDPFFLAGGASALSPAPGSQDAHLSQPGGIFHPPRWSRLLCGSQPFPGSGSQLHLGPSTESPTLGFLATNRVAFGLFLGSGWAPFLIGSLQEERVGSFGSR